MQPILKINLSTGETSDFIVPQEWEREYLGGASLAARLLYPVLSKDLDPLSPQSPLLFLNGPLSGTSGPTVGRFVVCGKSPATGLWAESNCGGFWGPELRFSGYDGIWITGKVEKPVYIWINDGRVEFMDASTVWGKDAYDSQTITKSEVGFPGAHVITIGPAGENGVLFASIMCDHGRAAGRTGLGAVMGAKKLKAIVVHGSGKPPLASEKEYGIMRSAANRALKQDNLSRVFHDLGTASVAEYADYLGAMPKKYFHAGTFSGVENVSGATMAETILTGVSACHACVIACGRVVRLDDGEKRKGPEYETIVSFGPNLLNGDLASITRLGEICDRFGMDTISAGGTIGLAFHLFEKGVITTKDTDGLELCWGDVEVIERLLNMVAYRDGIGEFIAQGSHRLALHFGVEEEAVQVNGLEVPYHDPRAFSGMALVYATSPRGACHNQSEYFLVDIGQADPGLRLEFFARQDGAKKASNVARHQDWQTVFNSLVMCLFANIPVETVVELINAGCGLGWSVDDLFRAGERAWNLKRVINNRLGLTRDNDKLPKAFFEPYKDGGSAGYVPPFKEMLEAYYAVRGWDAETGKPTPGKLVELNLDWVKRDIWGL